MASSTPREDEARSRVTALEREIKALGQDPAAAVLFHEMGLLWEDPLRNPRNAAVAYQNAYRLAPTFLANIRSARRLFTDVGNWQMVVQLLDAELALVESPRARAALMLEKGQVLRMRLSRHAEAIAVFDACLDLAPRELTLLVQLEQVFAETADYPRLVRVLRLASEAAAEPPVKAEYLTLAALILLDRLGQPEIAADCLRQAFALDPAKPLLLDAYERLAEAYGSPQELLTVLAAHARAEGLQSGPTFLRIAKTYERLGLPDEALAAYEAGRAANPGEALILAELAAAYEARGRHEELAEALLSWIAAVNDDGEIVALNLRLAELYEEKLKRDADAIGRYRAILDRLPHDALALAALGKLCFRTKDYAGLLAIFEAEIAAAQDPRQRAGRLFKAAELLETRLNRTEEAILRYQQCLTAQPGYLPAQKALAQLFERSGRFADLIALHEQELTQTSDRDQAIATLTHIAEIHEERLRDLGQATSTLKRVLEVAPDHLPTLRSLARLYERAGAWRELVEVQETEATLTGDTKQVLALHHRNAEILEEQLKDRTGAIAVYERVLALSPMYLPALKALGRLYAEEGRWERLIGMYRAEAEISPSTEHAAALIFKIGEINEQRLSNENDAISAYQEVLTLAPAHFSALRALARIYRAQGAFESLIEVLRSEAANRQDPMERANALYQAASIWEEQLGRADLARDGYHEVLRLTPGHSPALRALERMLAAEDDVRERVALLEREAEVADAPGRLVAQLKLARLYLDKLDDPSRAARACEAALALSPTDVTALKLLQRARTQDRPSRLEVRARLCDQAHDVRLKSALRLANVADNERGSRAGEAATPPAIIHELWQALLADPDDAALDLSLEGVLQQAKDQVGLIELYLRRLERVSDPQERAVLLLRIGDTHEQGLGDPIAAAAAYEQAASIAPDLLPALSGARRCWEAADNIPNTVKALEREAAATRDTLSAVERWLRAAELSAEKLSDSERAVRACSRALERDPLHAQASARLEALLSARGGASDLALLRERRADAKLAQSDAPAAVDELYEAARIFSDQAKDDASALKALDRALRLNAGHPDALLLKADLLLKGGQHAEAAAAYSARAQLGGPPEVLEPVHMKLAALYQDRLSDASRAVAHLTTVLSMSPRNIDALSRLATLHTSSRNWTGAADCLRQLIELESDPSLLARHTLALAQIHDEGFADPAQAAALYQKALELSPGEASTIDRLIELYQRTGNLPELAVTLERHAAKTPEATLATALRQRAAELFAGPLRQGERAIALLKQVTEDEPTSIAARALLAEVYGRDASSTGLAIEEHRTLLRLEPTRVESIRALFKVWEGQRANDRAFCAAGVLVFLKAANPVELAFHAEAKTRLPAEAKGPLTGAELDLLRHPSAKGPLLEVLRSIGDQLSKIYPPAFEGLGVDRRADRLRPDNIVYKAIRQTANLFGLEALDVYQMRRTLVTLETTDPLSVWVGQDVIRKYNVREQRFLWGRACMGLLDKTAIAAKLRPAELAELFASAIAVVRPGPTPFGDAPPDRTKQLRRALSRRTLKMLEPLAAAVSSTRPDLDRTVEGIARTLNRAGLLLSGDVAAGLTAAMRDGPQLSEAKPDSAEAMLHLVRQRDDVSALIGFALSDELFRLRQRLSLSV